MKNLIKLFFLIIIISYNLINHNYIFADQDIVKNYNVTSEIPEGIKFSIELLNYDEIDDIQVKFKIDGRNSFQYEYLKLPKDNNLIEHFHCFPEYSAIKVRKELIKWCSTARPPDRLLDCPTPT